MSLQQPRDSLGKNKIIKKINHHVLVDDEKAIYKTSIGYGAPGLSRTGEKKGFGTDITKKKGRKRLKTHVRLALLKGKEQIMHLKQRNKQLKSQNPTIFIFRQHHLL